MIEVEARSWHLVFFFVVYASTKACETEEKEIFYAKVESVLDQCPCQGTLIVLGDFNTINASDRDGYEKPSIFTLTVMWNKI